MRKEIKTPLTKEAASGLKAGDVVSLTGYIYTGRDAAHKRMVEDFEKTGKFPFDVKDQVIYYVDRSPAKPGKPVGSAGPPHRAGWTPTPRCFWITVPRV